MRRLILGIEAEQQPQRRKQDFARTRRRDAQENIERREQDQRGESGGRGEAERQAEHSGAASLQRERRQPPPDRTFETHAQGEQRLRGRPVGAMQREAPAARRAGRAHRRRDGARAARR